MSCKCTRPFGFTGEPPDPTGLVNLRARTYDPSIGRILKSDRLTGELRSLNSLHRFAVTAHLRPSVEAVIGSADVRELARSHARGP
jgi:RHS repeat-associated protein